MLAASAAPPLADDAVEAALLTSGFRQCKTDVAAIDDNTTAGRQRILEVALMSGEVILKRLIFTGSQNLARRDPLLALLPSIRPYLSAYLGYCQAVHPLTVLARCQSGPKNGSGARQMVPSTLSSSNS